MLIAQPAPQTMRSVDLVTPPGSTHPGVAHIQDIKIGDRRQIHTVVVADEGSAELTFDGRTIQLGDGYKIVRETLANTRGVHVERLTASTPDGATRTAIIVVDKESSDATSIGMDDYVALLKGSHDALIAAEILPQLAFNTEHAARSVNGIGPIAAHGDDCLEAGIAVEAASVGVILGCGSDNPVLCMLALYNLGVQLDKMVSACPTPTIDNSIGWG